MWKYVYLIIYLRNKDRLTLNGLETQVVVAIEDESSPNFDWLDFQVHNANHTRTHLSLDVTPMQSHALAHTFTRPRTLADTFTTTHIQAHAQTHSHTHPSFACTTPYRTHR